MAVAGVQSRETSTRPQGVYLLRAGVLEALDPSEGTVGVKLIKVEFLYLYSPDSPTFLRN